MDRAALIAQILISFNIYQMRVNGGSNYVPTVINLTVSLKKKLLKLLIAKKGKKGIFPKPRDWNQETGNFLKNKLTYRICPL